jgi:hypothetical protein
LPAAKYPRRSTPVKPVLASLVVAVGGEVVIVLVVVVVDVEVRAEDGHHGRGEASFAPCRSHWLSLGAAFDG